MMYGPPVARFTPWLFNDVPTAFQLIDVAEKIYFESKCAASSFPQPRPNHRAKEGAATRRMWSLCLVIEVNKVRVCFV